MDNKFGRFIEKLRGKTSLRQAAEKSGLSHTYIRDLELGKNRKTKVPIVPTPDTIKRIAKAYNYDYEELLKVAGIIPTADVSYREESTSQKNEFIIRELANKYSIDLSAPGVADKLDKIIQIVVDDFEGKKQ